jgi:hypothetical protein
LISRVIVVVEHVFNYHVTLFLRGRQVTQNTRNQTGKDDTVFSLQTHEHFVVIKLVQNECRVDAGRVVAVC